jgi:hypothetical protein
MFIEALARKYFDFVVENEWLLTLSVFRFELSIAESRI